jgi:predicted  nucleic acid-binding Zn-ribbon protein
MGDNGRISAALSDKIERLIVKFNALEIENGALKEEVEALKSELFEKNEMIAKLQNDIKAKNLETDELLEKIESVLKI